MSKREIIIGDVHGCYDELCDLLEKLKYDSSNDELYFVGDVINRGPASKAVLDLILKLGVKSILGNHEYELLQQQKCKRDCDNLLVGLFGSDNPKYLKQISKWPLFIEKPDFTIVHAGLVPGVPIEKTKPDLLVNIRTWDGIGKDIWSVNDPPWFELYPDEKMIVFGHWAQLNGVQRQNVIGLDTGCVYGKRLSALILPDRQIVSVAARMCYCPIQ